MVVWGLGVDGWHYRLNSLHSQYLHLTIFERKQRGCVKMEPALYENVDEVLDWLRLSFLLMVTTAVGYYVAIAKEEPQVSVQSGQSTTKKKNVTKNICYKRKFNGGILLLTAKEGVANEKERLVLSKVKASFAKNGKNITIESGKCEFNANEKRANLQGNVIIKSADTTCCTESAVVDFAKHTIFGKAKVTGVNARGSFVSDGFSIEDESVIKLKKVKIKGKK